MFALFPQMRSSQVNKQADIVSCRALRICELLHQAGVPVRANKLQQALTALGETWAEGRAGYMAIWGQLQDLQDAGIVVRQGNTGFQIIEDGALAEVFADGIARAIKESIPDIQSLGPLRESILRDALFFAMRSGKRGPSASSGGEN